MIDSKIERGLKTIKMSSYDDYEFKKAITKNKTMDKKNISRFAILKDEHCCFGYFEEFHPDCELCEASLCCEENTDDKTS